MVLAVQDRTYRMNSELMLGIGVLPLDAFYKGLSGEVSYTYHFSDSFAWQIGRFLYSYNVATGLQNQLDTRLRRESDRLPADQLDCRLAT